MRKDPLSTGCTYHVYNRGVDKRTIFLDSSYYTRFLSLLEHCLKYDYPYSLLKRRLEKAQTPSEKQLVLEDLRSKKISPPVKIISFCLMPNHYHLTLEQMVTDGVTKFIHRVSTSYSKYFNIRQERTGILFEANFKSVIVESEEQLLHLSRYQHLNPREITHATEELINYPWSSLLTYLGTQQLDFVDPTMVLSNFRNSQSYLDFVLAEIDEYEPLRLNRVAIDDDFGWFRGFRILEKDAREKLKKRYLDSLIY